MNGWGFRLYFFALGGDVDHIILLQGGDLNFVENIGLYYLAMMDSLLVCQISRLYS